MSKNQNNEEMTEATETDKELRVSEFKKGLQELQEETEITIQEKLNYGDNGIVPYMTLVDVKELENNEDTEQTNTEESQ